MENAFLAFDVAGATKTYKDEIEELKEQNEQLAKALGKATVRADFAEGKLKSLDLSNKKTLIDSKHKSLTISDRKSTRLNSSHLKLSRMPSSA